MGERKFRNPVTTVCSREEITAKKSIFWMRVIVHAKRGKEVPKSPFLFGEPISNVGFNETC